MDENVKIAPSTEGDQARDWSTGLPPLRALPAVNLEQGEALNAERFRMLEDIARELAGEVVFPTYFDAALRLRKDLQNPDLPTARIAKIVSIEPLIAAKLMQLAGSALYSPDGSPAKDLSAAISRLGVDLVRTTALAIAMNQLLRSNGRGCPCPRPEFHPDQSGRSATGRPGA